MRLAIAAVVLAGCGSDPRDCSLPAVVDDYAAGFTLDDCGSASMEGFGTFDPEPFQAAQSCVLDHEQQQRPFRVSFTSQGIEGAGYGAYVGMVRDGAWTLAEFGQSARGDGTLPSAARLDCTDLRAISPCQSLSTDLCLECEGATAAEPCMP